ncbi:MAG: DUF2029 domain-containing protein [Phycisphaerae bacterium]|nr:DUF2029 domain-containing protein [Phycisphaerae bacterium]
MSTSVFSSERDGPHGGPCPTGRLDHGKGQGKVNPGVILVVLIAALACYRFSLIGSGHFFHPDEWAYNCAEPFVDHLLAGEYFFGMIEPFKPTGRPGFVMVGALPVAMQWAVAALADVAGGTLPYYDAVSAFNVLVTLGIAWCLYALGRIWLGSPWYALLLVAVHGLLVNSNVWIRHMVPYHEALLMGLVALCIVSRVPHSCRGAIYRGFAGGLLAGLTFATYPGFFAMVILNGVVLLTVARHRRVAAASYAIGSAAVIGGFELLARSVGTSYLQNVQNGQERMQRWALNNMKGDSADEGYMFLWRYMRDVEGVIGVVLPALFVCAVALLLWRRRANVHPTVRATLAAAIGCFLLHVIAAVFMQRIVFYGRFLMLYLPFVVCGAVLALKHIPVPALRRVGVCGVLLASAGSFAHFARDYALVVYPPDFLNEIIVNKGLNVSRPEVLLGGNPDFAMVTDGLPDGLLPWIVSHETARAGKARFIGVNFSVRNSPEHYEPFAPPRGYRLVAQRLHPTAYAWAGYEGFGPQVRKHLLKHRHTVRLYERATVTSGSVYAEKE